MSDTTTTEPATTANTDPAAATTTETTATAATTEIERLRRENGAERTNAKAKAADEARAELAQTIGKTLGLVKDDEQADPYRSARADDSASASSDRIRARRPQSSSSTALQLSSSNVLIPRPAQCPLTRTECPHTSGP